MYEDVPIAQGVERFHATTGAILLDVRTPEEFAQGHIPGATNIELAHLDQVGPIVEGFDTPLFVYCTVGYRAAQAAAYLRQWGFTQVLNIGGIQDWRGEIE